MNCKTASSAPSQDSYDQGLKRDKKRLSERQIVTSISDTMEIVTGKVEESSPDYCECENIIEENSCGNRLDQLEKLEKHIERLNAEVYNLRMERDVLKEQLKSSKFCFDFHIP